MIRWKTWVLVVVVLTVFSSVSNGQWVKLKNNMFRGRGGAGALCYIDGDIWAGVRDSITVSHDSGKTWVRLPSPLGTTTEVRDFYFADKMHGLLSTSGQGVLQTTDGGMTWTNILAGDGNFWMSRYNGSLDTIHTVENTNGVLYTSYNGGKTWRQDSLGRWISCIAITTTGTLYVFAQKPVNGISKGWVIHSSDKGRTWSPRGAITDGDCFTLSVDSCDSKRLYLLNEDWATTSDGLSQVYLSTDGGGTWTPTDSNPAPFFSGSMVSTTYGLFAGGAFRGVSRSTDRGLHWKYIGGPSSANDSHNLVAIDENILFMLDTVGSLWRTTNSGGDSVSSIVPNAYIRLSSDRIIKDSSNIVVHLPIYCEASRVTGDLDMRMHFQTTSLRFVRSRLYDGSSFDAPASSGEGRIRLHVGMSALQKFQGSVLGYIDLLWTPIESDCERVTFDSISISDPCTDVAAQSFSGFVGVGTGCGIDEVVPNSTQSGSDVFAMISTPSLEGFAIRSYSYTGVVDADIFDERGEQILTVAGQIAPGRPLNIHADGLTDGVYHIRVTGKGVSETLKAVLRRR
ncbi:MAG: hypothetical protein JSS75_05725 [Bacteroidetes bacterium]|nr:hypothetical protein [Bacteroidota bacterium]